MSSPISHHQSFGRRIHLLPRGGEDCCIVDSFQQKLQKGNSVYSKESSCQTQIEKKRWKRNKTTAFTQSRSSSGAALCRLKGRKSTSQSISLQGEQCACEQTSTSRDRLQFRFICSLSAASVCLCNALKLYEKAKSSLVFLGEGPF